MVGQPRQINGVNGIDFRAEESTTKFFKVFGVTRYLEFVCWWRPINGSKRVVLLQNPIEVFRCLLGAAHQRDFFTQDIGNRTNEKWVMGATQDNGVNVGVTDCIKVFVRDAQRLITGCDSRLNEFNELWAGNTGESDIGCCFKCVVVCL